MTATVWPVDAKNGAPLYSGRMLRQVMSSLTAMGDAARPLAGLSGVRPGTPSTTVAATSTTWTVNPHAGFIDAEAAAEAGGYFYAFDAAVTGALTAADASNPRIDIISVQISDPAEGDGTAAPGVAVAYTAGVAAASPAAPTTPARSLKLAQISVPKAGGGAPTVSFVAPWFAAAGAAPTFPSLAALNLWTTAPANTPARVAGSATASENGDYVRSGTAWMATPATITLIRTTTALTTGSNTYGNMSATAAWQAQAQRGFANYSNGIVVPASGEYEVWWSLLWQSAGSTGSGALVGVALNAGATIAGGQVLAGVAPMMNGGAFAGSGYGRIRANAGDTLTLWGYGNGGPIAIGSSAQPNYSQWGARLVS